MGIAFKSFQSSKEANSFLKTLSKDEFIDMKITTTEMGWIMYTILYYTE